MGNRRSGDLGIGGDRDDAGIERFFVSLPVHSRSSRVVHSFLTPNVLGQSTEIHYSTTFTTHLSWQHTAAQYATTILGRTTSTIP